MRNENGHNVDQLAGYAALQLQELTFFEICAAAIQRSRN